MPVLTTKMRWFFAWTIFTFLWRGEGQFKILFSAPFFCPAFLGKLSLAFFSVLMSWDMLHMLSSPPDVLLKEEGTTAAFLPQGYLFFPHPPVSLHGHLYIWHCPSGPTLSCHHCLAEHPVDLVNGWLWPMVSPRDPSYLFAPLGLAFLFPHAPNPQGWCCFMVTLLRCQNCHLALSFFIQWSDWMLLYLLSFHHLWHGQSFPEYWGFRHWGRGCDFPYWLICKCHSRVIICLVFYCLGWWSWWACKGPQAVQL